jgi:hypothetical protein
VVYKALQSVAPLFGLWLAVYYLWRDFRYDAFREDIFSVRDEMFLWAAKGNIRFSNPAYTILRNRMNALLRHGHDLTVTRTVLMLVTYDGTKSDIAIQWDKAVEELPVEVKSRINWYDRRVTIFVFQHLIYCSFFRYLLIRPLMTGIDVHQLVETPVVASGVQRLESKAVEEDKRLLGQAATA